MGDTTRLKRVREFIAAQTGHPLGEITLSTRLVEEVGVDGDDAVELMEAFREEFHVDMSDFLVYYRTYQAQPQKWLKVVIEQEEVVTAYRVRRLKKGETIQWQR